MKKKNRPAYAHLISLLMLILVSNCYRLAIADPSSIAVLYPDVREPFKTVFLEIVKGINEALPETPRAYLLKDNAGSLALRNWFQTENINVAIALGTSSFSLAKELRGLDVKFVVGGVLIRPNGDDFSGITLIPDPEALFQRLNQMIPQVKNIKVIYNPQYNSWLINRAQQAARRLGIALDAFPAKDLRDAATTYRDVLDSMMSGSEALWLPPDPLTTDEGVILPLILERAWARNLAVFSSNPAHVKRGVLFAFYPDNFAMGKSLGKLALERLRNGGASQIQLLQDLLIAVNRRTADHLGVKLGSQEMREFDLVFPSK